MSNNKYKQNFKPENKKELQTAVNLWCNYNNIAQDYYGNINSWNTELITDMSNLFKNEKRFNDNISNYFINTLFNFTSNSIGFLNIGTFWILDINYNLIWRIIRKEFYFGPLASN